MRYVCEICGFLYDPSEGVPECNIPPGFPFDRVDEDWNCPECGSGKDNFTLLRG
ncbi:rubredoxin [Kiritimatiella glycovorans]|uniref:Rubredoxin n=1 Tax=Kiritimatiella glycovorans TaxID=1307763 RepID=A0A0G3EFE8_9BACT|nr:rubredoxin [Kiritimatiella glycovorans]AKJ63510.1 Rubredoxin [Kiritimatiella glycovorans]